MVNEVVEMRHAPFCTNVCFVVPVTATIAIHVACGRSSKRSAKSFIFFYDRYRKDPLNPHLEGLGETDSNLQESLQRLARDPSKAKKPAHLQWYQILVLTARSSLVRFRSSLCD